MSTDDITDESGNWLRYFFSRNGIKRLLSFFGFRDGEESSTGLRDLVPPDGKRNSPIESALDPTGEKSAEEMGATFRDVPKQGSIALARALLESLSSPDKPVVMGLRVLTDPADIANEIATRIKLANETAIANGKKGVDLSALDPTGTKSSAQMQDELHKRVVESYILNARKELYFLKNGSPDFAYEDDGKTQEWLDKANKAAKKYGFAPVDASVLDPMGKESADAVRRDILKAIESKHFEKASQMLYWSQHGGYHDQNKAAKDLRAELEEINKAALVLGEKTIDVSALDPNGGKYREQIDRAFAELDAGDIQTGIRRLNKEHADADKAAVQNESALAGHIRALDTPSQNSPQVGQKR
jgi:hypothetical protein